MRGNYSQEAERWGMFNMNTQTNNDFDSLRKSLIAKIHIAKKTLGLSECNYRALLEKITGKNSCKNMGVTDLKDVISEMKRLGFEARPKSKKRPVSRKADIPQVKKIRAYWISLYHLGEITDSSEEALKSFAQRYAKVEHLNWLTSYEADKVIKALRGWLDRVGYYHPTNSDYEVLGYPDADNICLINLQSKILGIEDIYEWLRNYTNGQYSSINGMPTDVAHSVIKQLGSEIREFKDQYGL